MSELTLVTDVVSTLGEGALWYQDRLYWVDIIGRRVHIYRPADESYRYIQLDAMVGTVVPRRKGGLVVALQNGFAFLDEDTGKVTPIADPEADKPDNRFNDGKCDPEGRFWAGTMALDQRPGAGALYVLHPDGRVEQKLTGVTISNGICWNADATAVYYVDTPTQQVVRFDYDRATGHIENPKVVVEIDPADGSPDGMTIDSDGNLWIALWKGGAVVCYNPETGQRLHKVEVPARLVTSCAFGGPDLSDLYITTARVDLSEEELAAQPLAGRLFKTRVPARGVPAFTFAG